MTPSVSMWSMDSKTQSEEFGQLDFIKWAESTGLTHVELLSYYMDKEGKLEQIVDALDKSNIKVSCYTILTDFTTSSDNRMQVFLKDLAAAEKLNAPFVRVLAGEENGNATDSIHNIVAGLKAAADAAAKKNIILVLENVGRYSCHSEQVKRIVDQVGNPALRVNFDTANSLLAGELPLSALERLKANTAYVHFKDFVSEKEQKYDRIAKQDERRIQKSEDGTAHTGVSAGQGIVPLPAIMKALKSGGFEGFISIEYEGTGDSQKDTEESLRYLKTLL